MKVNRVLSKKEVDELVKKAGREPQKRESESLKGLDDYKIINDVFNACLQDQIDGKLPTNYVYQIGMPSECLLKAGISNLPIELVSSRLNDKSMQENHPFDLLEIKNLPLSIQFPLAVFISATRIGSFVIFTELQHNSQYFVVAIKVSKTRNSIVVNSIRSVHYRTKKNILNWITEGLGAYFCSDFVEKWIVPTKKELLSKPQCNSVDVRKQLLTATNIVKDFLDSNNFQENLQGTEPTNWELYTPDWEFIRSFPAKDWRKAKQYAKEFLNEHKEVEYIEFQKCEAYSGEIINSDTWYRKDLGISLEGIDEDFADKESNETFNFAIHLARLYNQGEKLDWLKAKKIAKDFNISTETEIMQSCELAIVLESRRIAQNGNSIRQQYEELKDLYERQVNIKPLDTKSKVLQQYSTPCPLAYLLGTFIKGSSSRKERYFEPSAGNGMLTIALPENKTCVNEIDEVRISNLQSQNFANVWNFDSSNIKNLQKEEIGTYKGVITNPPFGKLDRKEQITRNGWDINTLDYKMAIYALDTMLDNGRASIIVGGKMWNAYWKPLSETSQKQVLFGQFKTFLGYLYAQYNVVDVIYIDGEYIYRKQGTQYPIVVILVDGRHEYNESNKPNYVFDKNRDKILTTFDQIFDRIFPYLENNDKEKEKRAKALFFKMKMQSVNFPSLGNNDYDDIFKKYTDFIKEALSSKTHSRIECTELISEHSKRIVNRLLKKNINKYYLTADDIRHSRNVHGKVTEYLKNQIPITELDFIRIPEILYSPTNIDLSNPNTKNGQGIRFVKEYTDGKIFCVMIDEYETEELSVKTNYKKPPLQGIDVLPKAAPKHNVRNARALPMLNANVVNFFRIK